jgi:hypothetical protein
MVANLLDVTDDVNIVAALERIERWREVSGF